MRSSRGAVAVLAERQLEVEVPQVIVEPGNGRTAMAHAAAALERHPDQSLEVIGVTGTNGKTTVTHLLGAILEAHGMPTTVVGTLDGERTTPEAPFLQRLPRGGARHRAKRPWPWRSPRTRLLKLASTAIRFDAAVFTNLGQDHLDYHHTME